MKTIVALMALVLVSGCRTVDLPSRLPVAKEAVQATTGAWMVVYDSIKQVPRAKSEGELVSVEKDSVFLFSGAVLRGIKKDKIKIAKLFIVDPPIRPASANIWVLLGILSTASHGFGLIISAPVWLIAGSISAAGVASSDDEGDLHYPENKWSDLALFARFPQGFPTNLDRARLQERVWMPRSK